jgi:repressor LexA
MKGLTQRQTEILDLIREHLIQYGRPPTRVEIANILGFRSATAAENHLRALHRKGYITLSPGASRNIRLTEAASNPDSGLPLVGRVAAGSPVLAQEHIEHWGAIESLFEPRPDYLLRVNDMSMRDVGILDGDLVAIHRTPEAHPGQIVVARLAKEVTVKRLEVNAQGAIRLLPENPAFEAIPVNPKRDGFAIEGIVVGVLRTKL